MSRVIRISEITFQRLQKLAVPLEDTPASVIEKLLDFYDLEGECMPKEEKNAGDKTVVNRTQNLHDNNDDSTLEMRTPRQRGAIVQIGGKRFNTSSLRELYEQVLQFLDNEGLLEKLRPHMPIRTSSVRYLLASKPIHPNGNDFRSPAKYGQYFMESHKNWSQGISHLQDMLRFCGLEVEYLG